MSKVSRHFSTGAEVSCGHFGTILESKTKHAAYPKASIKRLCSMLLLIISLQIIVTKMFTHLYTLTNPS